MTSAMAHTEYEDDMTSTALRTMRPKIDPLWKTHDMKANKQGQRSTISWVGRSIVGEDGLATGQRAKGASYHGEWGENKKSGYGVQVSPSGEKYEGQWGNGLRNGEGTLWVRMGPKATKLRKLYVGGWRDDQRHGRGTCFLKNGEFFQGSWDGGKMHGQGTLRYANGDLYIGEWHDGSRSGQGTLNKANGDCYEGYWLEDRREGSGSYFYASSGKVFVGEWAADLPKAGVYTQASPNPQQATLVPHTSSLPPVRLALPADVLEGAMGAVRRQRGPYRARQTPLDRVFNEDETASLRNAFETAQRANHGYVGKEDMGDLCARLGTEVAPQRLRRLLSDIVGPQQHEGEEVHYAFEDFLRVVALLLDEEADVHGRESSADVGLESWDEGYGSGDFPSA